MDTAENTQISTDLVIFSYASPFADVLRLDKRFFSLFNKTIAVKQQWKEGGRGGTDIGFGASVYNASFVLANYIQNNACLVCKNNSVIHFLVHFISFRIYVCSSSESRA
jgi:hypothetical protein